jgi:hypothetical protein
LRPRLASWIAAIVASLCACSPAALAAALEPQSLTSSLQRDPVQSIAVPRSSFSWLSRGQIASLRAEIARLDPGRIWVLVVSPRSQSLLDNLASPAFGALPAGTLIAVAESRVHPDTTGYWIGASWESGDAAQKQINDVIQGYKKGQGSLFDDLRLVIRSFARRDAAAGHPPLASASNSGRPVTQSGQPSTAGGQGGSSHVLLIILAVVGAILLLAAVVSGGRWLPGAMRSAHRRREASADARAQASADFTKLGEQIAGLDIDSSMANASAQGKDEYAQALDCYQEAERRLKQSDDAYQFERAVGAIRSGLEHVAKADQLFNPTPTARQTGEVVDELTELAALHDRGALTDAEFAKQKSKLLGH